MYNRKMCSCWIFILAATYSCVDGTTLNENDFEPTPKGTLKTIEVSEDGYLIDCVDIYKQPALDNPLMNDLQIEPSLPNQRVFNKANNLLFDKIHNRLPKQIQNWHKYGHCPQGTIPIRRNWKNNGTISRNAHPGRQSHEYAYANQADGTYHGAGATFNLWNPHVSGDNEFSLAQLWITSGNNSNLNTIEVGWMVYPNKYRDTRSIFFTYWTADGYRHGCYNHECQGAGFQQTDSLFCLGCPLEPVSEYGGEMQAIRIDVKRMSLNHPHEQKVVYVVTEEEIVTKLRQEAEGNNSENDSVEVQNVAYQEALSMLAKLELFWLQEEGTHYAQVKDDWITGHWVLYVNNDRIGYFPRHIFTSLGNGADRKVTFGGEITNNKDGGRHTATQMGSGHFSAEGYRRASYIHSISVVDNQGVTKHATLSGIAPQPGCYDILPGPPGTPHGTYFFYGGPGYSQQHCP